MFDELFPGTIDQLNKLTVIGYDHDQGDYTNAQRDEKLHKCQREDTNQRTKV